MDKVYNANKDLMRTDLPEFSSGDTVSLAMKIIEGNRTRTQVFEGVVIAISSGGGLDKKFTIRKISNGIGVEKIHFMKRMFSEDDLAVMGRLRDSFNPNNKLSPDKMLPTAGACGMEQTHPGRRAAM